MKFGTLGIVMLLTLSTAFAQERAGKGGAQSGGGGDEVVLAYRHYLDTFLIILKKYQGTFMRLGANASSIESRILEGPGRTQVYEVSRVPAELAEEMTRELGVASVKDLLVVGGVKKTAYSHSRWNVTILSEDFLIRSASFDPLSRIRLAAHEVFVLEGLERTDVYTVSSQINGEMLAEVTRDVGVRIWAENLKPSEVRNVMRWVEHKQPNTLDFSSFSGAYDAFEQAKPGQTFRLGVSGPGRVEPGYLLEGGLGIQTTEVEGKKAFEFDFTGRLYLSPIHNLLKQDGSDFIQFGATEHSQFAEIAIMYGFLKHLGFGSASVAVKLSKASDLATQHINGQLVSLTLETRTRKVVLKNLILAGTGSIEAGRVNNLKSSVEGSDPLGAFLVPGVQDYFTRQTSDAGGFLSGRLGITADYRRIGFQINLMSRKWDYQGYGTEVIIGEDAGGNLTIDRRDLGTLDILSRSMQIGGGFRLRF